MKKLLIALVTGFVLLISSTEKLKAQDPYSAIIAAAVKTVIKAFDLQVQRIQTSTIWLQEAQKTLENAMSELHLGEITGWVQKMKDLYGDYFQELWKVKSIISLYDKARDITQKQLMILSAYQKAMALFKADKHFTPAEIEEMGKVYSGIIEQSLRNVDQLTIVISSFSTQMTDSKRLEIINAASDGMDRNYSDLVKFNNDNAILSLQRSTDQNEYDFLRKMYGIQ